MAGLALTADQTAAALKAASAELRYLLEREKVPEVVQAKFYHVGITTVSHFASFAEDAAELKTCLKDEFGLDAGASLDARVQVACVVCAHASAKTRISKRSELEGELEAKHLTKPLPANEINAMRAAFEKKWWKIEDKETPGKAYLEQRAEELESGEMKAEALTTVINREQEDPNILTPVWTATGQLSMKKGTSTIAEPANSEQLRARIILMGTGLIMLGTRHTDRAFLQDITPQLFQSYLSYLLGDFCYNLSGRDAEGHVVATPAWAQLLVYELQIRKKAWYLVNEGKAFKDALVEAWKDPVVKERFFTTPVAMASAAAAKLNSSGGSLGWGDGGKNGKKLKVKGKGKGSQDGGKGKGKGRNRAGMFFKTPDGEPICFKYNDKDKKQRCRNKACGYVHVCAKCFGNHPMYACTNQDRPAHAETQGEGAGVA
jgi:hypothetical protein